MAQSNLQTWLDDYCAARTSIAGGVIMVAPNVGAVPALAACWPRSARPDDRLLAAASATVNQQSAAATAGQDVPPERYANEGVISLPLRRNKDSIGAVAFKMHAANADRHTLAVLTAADAPAAAAPAPAAAASAANPPTDASALVRLHAGVLSQSTFAAAAQAAATGLAATLGFDRVAIGIAANGYCRVVAMSHGAITESGNALARTIGRTMDEAVEQQATLAWPASPGGAARILLAHTELSRRHDGAICTIPLVRDSRIFGAVTLQRPRDKPVTAAEIARCEQFVSLIGPALDLMHANERPWHARLRDHMTWRSVGAGRALSLAGLLIAIAALWTPVDYRVGAPARLEGVIQRSVVAPTDGFLKSAQVRPGDAVSAGQILAEMAEQDLQLEQKKLESEIAQHENAVRGALARGERTLYATSAAKADSAAAQLALIEQQRLRSQVRAPFDGVVIKGDLSQSQGAPVQRGEVLFLIAPSGEYRLIVEVDERDIPYLKPGQPGALSLAALPGRQIDFQVARITPLATARDGRNFFEVEGRLDRLPASARPGLQGVAKILVGERSFGWVWTHRLTDWMRLKLWSLGG